MKRGRLTACTASIAAVAMLAACGGGGFSEGDATATSVDELTSDSSKPMTVMIWSSSDAEDNAVKDAVAAWSKKSGHKASVVVSSDIGQQLSQGFASGSPADVFYLSPDLVAGYAANGSLLAYGDMLQDKSDYYSNILQSFTYDGKLYGVPKDVSTLQLVINTDMWKQAGLTDADYPQTWDDLENVAAKLTTADHVGLTMSGEFARIGVFMEQAGGGLVSDDGTKAIADSEGSVAGLTEVQKMLKDGVAKFADDLNAGWGGEAFGLGKAAMSIEGNWLTGSMKKDYPNINYKFIPLPEGPKGKKTLLFTNAWGIAADSQNQKDSLNLVEYLTSKETVMSFSEAFGVMPAKKSLTDEWKQQYPDLTAFADALDYAVGVPNNKDVSTVINDFNSQVGGLQDADVQSILTKTQKNLEAIMQ